MAGREVTTAELVQALFRLHHRTCPFCGVRAAPGRLTCGWPRCPEHWAAALRRALGPSAAPPDDETSRVSTMPESRPCG